MLLIQISAAQGPAECELAVKYTLQRLLQDAKQHAIGLTLLDCTESKHGYLSVLLQADGESVHTWANSWCGSIKWVFASKIRPAHKRKNWFVGVAAVADDRLCAAVRDIFACDKNRRTLYKVLRVNACRRTRCFAENHSQIGFGLIFADAAVDAAG
mgnify:CR=1 FL=1